MNYKIFYPASYKKREKKFFRKHPQLLAQYEKVLQLLELNPFHPSLRLHVLKGQLAGLYSVSINISYRLVIELEIKDNQSVLINIGDHDSVY